MRYKAYGQLDDPPIVDGDESFGGVITQDEPDILQPGMLVSAKNVRLDRGDIQCRKTTRPVTSLTDSVILENDNASHAIRWNDSLSNVDKILIAGNTSGYSHTGNESDSLETLPYPPGYSLNDDAFLMQTGVNVILFPGDSLVLNFTLDSSAVLGSGVLRLSDYATYDSATGTYGSEKRFLHFKQGEVDNFVQSTSASGETITTIETRTPHSFIEGELIYLDVDPLKYWKISEVINQNELNIIPAVTDPSNSWLGTAPIITLIPGPPSNPLVYSLDDQCPSSEFATWAGNRLVVPGGNDDIFISSPLSTSDFPTFNRLTIGSNDSGRITALEPMGDDSLIVFKTNSLYLVTGIYSMRTADEGGSLAILRISDQMGCENFRAVQVVGQEIMFLNRKGVYALTLNTKGQGGIGLPPQAVRITDLPLSRDINDQFDEDFDYDSASLTFYSGRLYLLFSSKSYISSRRPTSKTGMWVYNTLLARWESFDEYRGGGLNLVPIRRATTELILFHSSEGLIELEKHENIFDEYNSSLGDESLVCEFRTRQYRAKTFQQKHWKRGTIIWDKMTSEPGDQIEYKILYENPNKIGAYFNRRSYDSSGNLVFSNDNLVSRFRLLDVADSIGLLFESLKVRWKFKRLVFEASEGTRTTKEIK